MGDDGNDVDADEKVLLKPLLAGVKDSDSVKVAVRLRPLSNSEVIDHGGIECIDINTIEKCIKLSSTAKKYDRGLTYTFDHVFDIGN